MFFADFQILPDSFGGGGGIQSFLYGTFPGGIFMNQTYYLKLDWQGYFDKLGSFLALIVNFYNILKSKPICMHPYS